MKVLAFTIAILALSAVSAEAQRPNCKDTYTHYTAPGQVDNGNTVGLPNGGFQTTYADGWTHSSEPDSSYGAGGRRMTDKDETGRVRTISKCDPKNVLRLETNSDFQNGVTLVTTTTWNASGAQIKKDTKRMAAGAPPQPTSQGQQVQPGQQSQPSQPPGYPTAGRPPPGPPPQGPPPGDQTMNGPPPGYDQDPNGPPPPGYGPPPTGPAIGVGGVGFGFGFGIGHKP